MDSTAPTLTFQEFDEIATTDVICKLAACLKKTSLAAGLSKEEVNDALLPVRMTFEAFVEKHGAAEAYFKCVRRFQDAIYDAYTYPQVKK